MPSKNLNTLIRLESSELALEKAKRSKDSQYTLYKNDDLEAYISNEGRVYTSQSAMARMLQMQQGHLSSVLKRADTVADVVNIPVETVSGKTANVSLYGVKTLLDLAVKYSPELAVKFAEMGATMYMYQQVGYKILPVKQDKTEPPSDAKAYNDYMETAHVALGKLLNLHRFAEDKPGLESYLALAEAVGSKSLGGKMTLAEMAESFGVEVPPEYSRLIGRALAGASRAQEEKEPTQRRIRLKNASGNHQSYFVTEYSVDYLSLFASLCKNYSLL